MVNFVRKFRTLSSFFRVDMTSSSSKLEYNRKYRALHRDRYKEHVRKWRKNNPERNGEIDENARLKRLYGISLDDYDRMLKEQGEKCAICKRPRSENNRNLHVDHNHATGKVRGLLCIRCNAGLGYFRESLELFDAAREYLLKAC